MRLPLDIFVRVFKRLGLCPGARRSYYLKVMMEACGVGVALLNKGGAYEMMNRAHAESYGYEDAGELIGKNWRYLYTPQRIAWFEREVIPALNDKRCWSGQSYGLRKDGTEYPQHLRLEKLDDGGMICVVRDLSEEIRNKNRMEMIITAVEAAKDGIAITDPDNHILFMNGSFLKIHGFDPDDRDRFMGTDWRYLYNENGQSQINDFVMPTVHIKGTWSGSMPVMRSDGSIFYGDSSLTKLSDGLILGVMRDITVRRMAEIEREELREQLFTVQKMQAIGRLAQGIADDFNEVLCEIQNCCRTMSAEKSMNVIHHVKTIHAACTKGHELVSRLTSFGPIKDKSHAVVDLAELAREIYLSFEGQASHRITLTEDIQVISAPVRVQPKMMEETIRHLISNAESAIPNKTGAITISLKNAGEDFVGLEPYLYIDQAAVPDKAEASASRYREYKGRMFLIAGYLQRSVNYYHLSVSDTGSGIDRDILPNIFDPFFTTKDTGERAGLGLFTVLGTTIGANGAIIVETVPDGGTNVHVFLPDASEVSQ